MTVPMRTLTIQGVFLAFITLGCFFVGEKLVDVFNHNFWLNIIIISAFVIGVVLCLFQVISLNKEYEWLSNFSKGKVSFLESTGPKILAPLNYTLKDTPKGVLTLLSMKSLLSSVEQRLDEKRELNRYLIGLCVFLGLVGTFWGLSKTIGAIATVISGIDVDATDIKDAFQNLKAGLQAPLTGMGYAFSSSLFGLLGSLALSFLDVQVSSAFSKFYQSVEKVLSAFSQKNSANTLTPASGPAYGEALVERLAEAMNTFQTQLDRSEDGRIQSSKALLSFSGNIHQLNEVMKANLTHMDQLTHQHFELQQQVARLLHVHNDEASKKSIKMIECTAQNILDELSNGRSKITDEMRKEIRMLSKTFSAMAVNE